MPHHKHARSPSSSTPSPSRKKSSQSQEKVWVVRGILRESTTKYLIDWEDDSETGEKFAPTWEPKRYANDEAIATWERKKRAKGQPKSAQRSPTIASPAALLSSQVEFSPRDCFLSEDEENARCMPFQGIVLFPDIDDSKFANIPGISTQAISARPVPRPSATVQDSQNLSRPPVATPSTGKVTKQAELLYEKKEALQSGISDKQQVTQISDQLDNRLSVRE